MLSPLPPGVLGTKTQRDATAAAAAAALSFQASDGRPRAHLAALCARRKPALAARGRGCRPAVALEEPPPRRPRKVARRKSAVSVPRTPILAQSVGNSRAGTAAAGNHEWGRPTNQPISRDFDLSHHSSDSVMQAMVSQWSGPVVNLLTDQPFY
eukprot:COSAG01_NODE_3977_length_5475_cov_4.105283_2_plen_154_part_00